jgi:hypothetical protein
MDPHMSTPRRLAFLLALGAPLLAQAHHSYTEYDQLKTLEIRGTLLRVEWRNPHVRFVVRVPARAGKDPVTWDIESSGINNLRRMGAEVGVFQVGETVTVAGWPSKRSHSRMYVTNILSRDGHELVLWRFSKPRWAKQGQGYGTGSDKVLFATGTPSSDTSLFRVWSSDYDDPDAAPETLLMRSNATLPLTAAARKSRAAFDPTRESALVGCRPKGMPIIMAQPFPIQFVDQGKTILLRAEEYDTVRTLHINGPPPSASQPKTPLGYSTARWEGKTLVVTTTHLSGRFFNQSGVPLGKSAQFVERFTPSADGSRLNYSLVATDPEVFAQPVELKRSWVFRSGEKVMPFNCSA